MRLQKAAKLAREWKWSNPRSESDEYPYFDSIKRAIDGIVDLNEPYEMDDLLFLLAFENESEYVLEKIEDNSLLAWKLAETGVSYPDPEARWQIGVLLGGLGGDRAKKLLAQLCLDDDEYVRRRSLLSLREIDAIAAEKIAMDWLSSEYEYSRMVAIDTLFYLKSPKFKSALKRLKNDPSEIVQNRLQKWLKKTNRD